MSQHGQSFIVRLSTGTCTFIRSRPEKKDFLGPVNICTLKWLAKSTVSKRTGDSTRSCLVSQICSLFALESDSIQVEAVLPPKYPPQTGSRLPFSCTLPVSYTIITTCGGFAFHHLHVYRSRRLRSCRDLNLEGDLPQTRPQDLNLIHLTHQ